MWRLVGLLVGILAISSCVPIAQYLEDISIKGRVATYLRPILEGDAETLLQKEDCYLVASSMEQNYAFRFRQIWNEGKKRQDLLIKMNKKMKAISEAIEAYEIKVPRGTVLFTLGEKDLRQSPAIDQPYIVDLYVKQSKNYFRVALTARYNPPTRYDTRPYVTGLCTDISGLTLFWTSSPSGLGADGKNLIAYLGDLLKQAVDETMQ